MSGSLARRQHSSRGEADARLRYSELGPFCLSSRTEGSQGQSDRDDFPVEWRPVSTSPPFVTGGNSRVASARGRSGPGLGTTSVCQRARCLLSVDNPCWLGGTNDRKVRGAPRYPQWEPSECLTRLASRRAVCLQITCQLTTIRWGLSGRACGAC